jgi:hypothetical protein
MLKKLKEKIKNLDIKYLLIITIFLLLTIILNIGSLVYDTVLLGVILGNKIAIKDWGFTILSLVICIPAFIFMIGLISKKRTAN